MYLQPGIGIVLKKTITKYYKIKINDNDNDSTLGLIAVAQGAHLYRVWPSVQS